MKPAQRQPWFLFLPGIILFSALCGPVALAPAGTVPATRESDFFLYYFPMAETAFGMLREGTFPLWNPYLDGGVPFLASIEVGVLYPPNWLHLALPAERAFCVSYVLHVLLAGGGVWMYSRGRGRSTIAALCSAQAFAFAAPTILHHDMGMTSVVYSSAWCPLILALVDRCLKLRTARSACLLSLALACQFLAGFPMFTLLLAALVPAWVVAVGFDWRQPVSRESGTAVVVLGLAALLALGLVAPQLLATREYVENSQRNELRYEQATHCSFPAPNLLTLVVPEFFGNDRNCLYWGESYLFDANTFCGTTTLVLAVVAVVWRRSREVLFWASAAILILFFCLGKYSWFYDLCFVAIPGVDRFRGVSRLAIFAVLGLSVLSGIGLDVVLAGICGKGLRRLAWMAGVPAATALAGSCYLLTTGGDVPPTWQTVFSWVRDGASEVHTRIPREELRQFLEGGFATMLRSLAISSGALLLASLALGWRIQNIRHRHRQAVCLVALLAAELYLFDAQYIVLSATAPWRSIAQKMQAQVGQERGPFRVAAFSENPPFPLNRFLYGRLQDVGGHENFVLLRYGLFVGGWAGLDLETQTFLTIPNYLRIYDLLNVKYFLALPRNRRWGPRDELVQEQVVSITHHSRRYDYSLYRNRTVLPRVSLVHSAHSAGDAISAVQELDQMREQGLSFETALVLEGDPGIALEDVSETERRQENVTLVEWTPNRIVVDARCLKPGLLLYCENFFPGWEATIDGRPAPILPANAFMRAVPVSAGDHRVEMIYRPAPFRLGCRIAATTALAFAFVLLFPPIWRLIRVRSL